MTALYIILGLLAAFIVITLIRAAFFTAPKPQREEFPRRGRPGFRIWETVKTFLGTLIIYLDKRAKL